MYSRVKQPCKFIGTKESVFIRKEFNSHWIGLVQQHGCRFVVLKQPYGCHDDICIRSLVNLVSRVSHLTAPRSPQGTVRWETLGTRLLPGIENNGNVLLLYSTFGTNVRVSFIILNTILISRLLIYTENSWNSMSDFINKWIITSIKWEDYEKNLLTSGDR